jgi:hypothetical protein
MLWKLAKWVLGFIGGVVLVTLAGLLIDALGLLGADHPMELAKRWCIGGDSETELTIRLHAPRPVSIKVSRPGSWFGFESLRLCEEGGIEFCLEQQGRYGPPEARYSGGSEEKRFTWIDLNNDGWFDVLSRTPENSWYIRDNESWLRAVIEGSVARTERSVFEFNAQTGRWEEL